MNEKPNPSMKVILERFDVRRVRMALRKKGWQLTSVSGHCNVANLRFVKISGVEDQYV